MAHSMTFISYLYFLVLIQVTWNFIVKRSETRSMETSLGILMLAFLSNEEPACYCFFHIICTHYGFELMPREQVNGLLTLASIDHLYFGCTVGLCNVNLKHEVIQWFAYHKKICPRMFLLCLLRLTPHILLAKTLQLTHLETKVCDVTIAKCVAKLLALSPITWFVCNDLPQIEAHQLLFPRSGDRMSFWVIV